MKNERKMTIVYKPEPPCLNCPNRTITCHNSKCKAWVAYKAQMEKFNAQQRVLAECVNTTCENIEKYSHNHGKIGSNINENF